VVDPASTEEKGPEGYRILRISHFLHTVFERGRITPRRRTIVRSWRKRAARCLAARSALTAVTSPVAPPTDQDVRAGYRGSVTATSEAQPGTRSGGIAPAPTLTRGPKGSRPKGKGTTKISLTDRIVSTAARWIYEGRRLDMQGLADELGVSRVTLFRRVGGREELISQALWRLTERMLELAVERWEAERPEGELHTPGTIRHINAMVAGSTGLRRLLDDEPALTMRVLTDPRGRVQSGIVALNEELLRRDMEEFGLVTIIEPSALAYALVRLGESFLYADVLAARKPDVATANRLQQAIIEGILP
jgi:AcrR family transcriptional regulator